MVVICCIDFALNPRSKTVISPECLLNSYFDRKKPEVEMRKPS